MTVQVVLFLLFTFKYALSSHNKMSFLPNMRLLVSDYYPNLKFLIVIWVSTRQEESTYQLSIVIIIV